ncbi:MAG: hypothetical protein ABSE21_08820 [Bryobacteraceae bacterium]
MILVVGAEEPFVFVLLGAVVRQDGKRGFRHHKMPCFARLCALDPEAARPRLFERLRYIQFAGLFVQVRPLQRQQLAAPASGGRCQDDEWVQPSRPGAIKEELQLFLVDDRGLPLRQLR